MSDENTSQAILDVALSEEVNLVDALLAIARSSAKIASSILPADTSPGDCPAGGKVDSLTEAVMGTTKALCMIARAIDNLADAVSQK